MISQATLTDAAMLTAHFHWSFANLGRVSIVLLLSAFFLFGIAMPVAAAPATAAGDVAAPGVLVWGSYFNEILGNRTRMIQVACVFVAIGVFVLTRSYK
jgi:hypothetical protein